MSTTTPFIDKVTQIGHFQNRAIAEETVEAIFRSMRETMTLEAIKRVEEELKNKTAVPADEVDIPATDKAVEKDLAELWKDPDPVASKMSQDNPPQQVDSDQFLYHIDHQVNLPPGVTPESAVKAVFSLTKPELSDDRIQEIATYLPDKIQKMWMDA
jgi:uncharacterized protein (DUF2267 family)